MQYLDAVDEAASQIGGVNTVVDENGKLVGYNTDYIGVTRSLTPGSLDLKGRPCIVLGVGGAGRAAIFSLLHQQAQITVVNRTYEKARETAKHFGCSPAKIEDLQSLLSHSQILISTLPPHVDIIPAHWLRKELVVFDANYKTSPLGEKARQTGCRIIKGEEWLLRQAVPAYRHFFGSSLSENDIETMRTALVTPPLPKPRNISLIGFMGTGKTEIGRILASRLKMDFIDIDEKIEQFEKRTIPGIFSTYGEAYFRAVEKRLLKQELENNQNRLFACGGGIVLDKENRDLLKNASLVIWLYASIETVLKRIPTGTRPLLSGNNPAQKAHELLDSRIPVYAAAADIVVGSERNQEETAERIHEEISKTFNH